MGKINVHKLKVDLKKEFPKYKWFAKENRGGMSWSYAVMSIPEVDGDDRNKLRLFLSKYESIDRDEHSGEILSGGNTFVLYYGEKR